MAVAGPSLPPAISPSATFSLLTGAPGDELYTVFGHSAIRLIDEKQQVDIVFNYGTFNFDTPNFYLKFAQGKLNYMLAIEDFEQFRLGYIYKEQTVHEQVFNLSPEQKLALFALLKENYRPENRYYKYDFFFDNCATRIRDILEVAYGNGLEFHYPDPWKKGDVTFRNLIDRYLLHHHWSDFGIDLALGMPTDRVTTPREYMFLPDYLSEAFALATLNGRPLVSPRQIMMQFEPATTPSSLPRPALLTWLLFLLVAVLSWAELSRRRIFRLLDYSLFTVVGLAGWVIFLLWFFTDHITTKNNLNLLWAIPLYFPLVFVLYKPHYRVKAIRACQAALFFTALALLVWLLTVQKLHFAILPIAMATSLRLLLFIKRFKIAQQ